MKASVTNAIKAHAVECFPRESCGLIVNVNGFETYVPCRNKAADAQEHFVLHPEDYADAEDRGEILAVVHSHPNVSAQPSQADLVACEASAMPWHIVSVSVPIDGDKPVADEIVSFLPNGYKAPLLGRQFFHGILDCYSLIRDFYKEEYGVDLPNWQRQDGWWERGENLYLDHYDESNFQRVFDEPQRGDVILMQVRSKVPNHAAIYLGDGKILHHMHGRLSTREIYGGYWAECTVMTLRYKDFINV